MLDLLRIGDGRGPQAVSRVGCGEEFTVVKHELIECFRLRAVVVNAKVHEANKTTLGVNEEVCSKRV